jgi:hypothetical protein
MYKDKISLSKAMSLELIGDITIVDTSPESLSPYLNVGQKWKDAFTLLQAKHRHISPDKLLTFLSAKYLIEINEGMVDENTNTYSWRYLHGVQNSNILAKATNDIEYVYILVNAGYPDIVKIGMTTKTVDGRVTGLNASSTVDEWVAKFALPVSKGNAIKVEQSVHKFFASSRISSDKGGSREFFTVDPLTAFDKVREVGALFMVGNPIVY